VKILSHRTKWRIKRHFRLIFNRVPHPEITGYDPDVSLGGGRYYLNIGTGGIFRRSVSYRITREDLELLAEIAADMLRDTELYNDGTYRAKERTP
jgi:hypothetical protein